LSLTRAILATAFLLTAPALAQTGEIVVGQTFLTAGADPARGSNGWALASHGVAETLFTVGRDGAVVPLLAERADRVGPLDWRVVLRDDARFPDGAPVDAAAVAAGLNRTMAENPAARASAGRIAFAVIDARTLSATTERPTPVLASVLAEWPMAVHRPGDGAPAFTGAYRIASMAAGDEVRLVPNPHYPGAAERVPVRIRRFGDAQALSLALEAGELDLAFNVPVEALRRLRARDGVTVKSFPVAYQYMAWMNTTRPQLSDVRVRRAIDLALDRAQLVQAIGAGEVATGAFARTFPFASADPRPTDVAEAARLLDEAGWVRGAGGTRTKDGQPLRLTIFAYPQRPDLITMQPVIRAQLQRIGVQVETRVTENPNPFGQSGDFDILLWAQHTAPAGDPAFFLGLFLRTGAANNFARWSAPAFDAVLDRMAETGDPAARADLAREAERIVFDGAPVAYLATPVWHVGLSARLAGYEPWGSDYYVIRPDLKAAR
jgi:peptide/nickel transport system substrate-binding protein